MEKTDEVSIRTIVKDDLGQEFQADVILTIKEIEQSLKTKGYRIVKG